MAMRLLGPVYLVGGQDFNMVYLDWPANDCNVYLLDTGDSLVLVDCGCGDSLAGILSNIEKMDFLVADLSHVLLTHAHLPHAGAAEDLRKMGLEVVASAPAAEALGAGGPLTVAYHYQRRFKPVRDLTTMEGGEELTLGAMTFRGVAMPGHSSGCTGFEVAAADRRMLFCGDTVRSPHLEQYRNRRDYEAEAYLETLSALLDDPPDVLYPGHGPFCLSNAGHWIGEEMKKLLSAGA
jgi:glyoxylase-like metal-dependent hydrolase (beta-lactamase superfamily II)